MNKQIKHKNISKPSSEETMNKQYQQTNEKYEKLKGQAMNKHTQNDKKKRYKDRAK